MISGDWEDGQGGRMDTGNGVKLDLITACSLYKLKYQMYPCLSICVHIHAHKLYIHIHTIYIIC